MKKTVLQTTMLSGMLFVSLFGAMQNPLETIELIRDREVFIPDQLGDIKLIKDTHGFHVLKDGTIYDIKNYNCDTRDQFTQTVLRMSNYQLITFLGRKIINITPEEFNRLCRGEMVEIYGIEKDRFLHQLPNNPLGRIGVNQLDNGEYIIHANLRLMGGVKDEGFANRNEEYANANRRYNEYANRMDDKDAKIVYIGIVAIVVTAPATAPIAATVATAAAVTATVVGVGAATAGVCYGGYRLFSRLFGSNNQNPPAENPQQPAQNIENVNNPNIPSPGSDNSETGFDVQRTR